MTTEPEERPGADPRLLDIIEFLPDATFVLDANKRVIAWNRAIEEMTGTRKEDIVGTGDYAWAVPWYGERRPVLIDLLWPENGAWVERYDFVQRQGDRLYAEVFVPGLRGGSGAHLWAAAAPLRDAAGNFAGAIESVRDITERKRIEEELRTSRARFVAVVESVMDAVIVIDGDQRIVICNNAAEQMFGHAATDVIGRSLDCLVPERFRGPERERLLAFTTPDALAGAMGRRREIIGLRANGEEFSADASISHRKSAGAWFGTVILRDVSEQKRINDALRASEERYRRITETITDYVLTVVVEHGTVTGTTHGPGCIAVTGYTPEDLARDSELWLAMVVHDDREAVIEQARAVLAGERFAPIEHRIVCKDGAMRWVRNTPVPEYGPDGALVAYDVLIQDISERRMLQGQLAQAQKMEAVGRLAGGVAHDFNNLLTAIRGFAELHLTEHPPSDPGREDLLEIERAAERAAQLTSGLLAFSRRADVHPGPLDLAQVASDAVVLLRRLVGEHIVILLDAASEVPCVLADPVQIEQVLLNLAANARDAMPAGGELRITVKSASISQAFVKSHPGAQPGRHVLLEVSDTGVGMDEATQRHVFEPFFTTKPPGEGTGLGLASVYGIVKQAHGYIGVESHRGNGSAFRIYLPELKDATPQARVRPRPSRTHNGGTETILLVEDDPAVRRFAQRALQEHGYRVLALGDPGVALDTASRDPGAFDALVTDVVMPAMSGPSLAERIGTIRPALPVLFISGYEAGALPAGAPPPLAKPFSARELADAVGALFGRSA